MSRQRKARIVTIPATGQVKLDEVELPAPGPEEVLVRMAAAPIHPADLNTIEGKYPGSGQAQLVGGREGSGVVEEVGKAVSTLEPGDIVLLPSTQGTWRDAAIYPVEDLVPVPRSVGLEQAALLRINPGTALRMLRDFVPLLPGEWLVQNGANSAVGRAVTQLARHFGWRTVNLVRDPSRLDEDLLASGNVFLADDSAADLHAAAETPLRLGLNAVGGESALRIANALTDGGTLVTYGAMSRQPLRIPNGLLIFRDLHVRGFWMTRWSGHATPHMMQALLSELIGLAATGVIRSEAEAFYPLERFADALAHAGQSRRRGKILFGAPELIRA